MRHRGILAAAMVLAISTLMASAEGGYGQRIGQGPVSFVAIARLGGSLAFSRNGGRMHVISRPGVAIRCCPEAAIAPDGRRVAYVVAAPRGRSVVYVASLGARPRAVARLPTITQGPTWSPDESQLAVPAADDRVFVIAIRSRRTRLIQLAPGTRFLTFEGWSPDSKQLLIAASEPHTTALFAVRVSDAARRSIAPLDRYGTSGSPEAAWSPDGSSIAFTDDCADVCDTLSIADATRGHPRHLPTRGSNIFSLAWTARPDNLAYVDSLATSQAADAVYLINTRTQSRRRISPPYGQVTSLTLSQDRMSVAVLYSEGSEEKLDVVDISTGRFRHAGRLPRNCIGQCTIWITSSS
jgi:Tol biopolymer transport system component